MKSNDKPKTGNELEATLYARALKDADFKHLLLSDPRSAIERMFGTRPPEQGVIEVIEEKEGQTTLVIPFFDPEVVERLTEEQLAEVILGTCKPLVGAAILGTCRAGGTLLNK